MNQKESNTIYKSLKMIFWDIPVGLAKSAVGSYGFSGLFLGVSILTPFLALLILFFYLFQTDDLNIPISLMRLLGAYYLIPFIFYFLWIFTGRWFEKKHPNLQRFCIRRWSELLVVFMYFNTIIGIIVVYFRCY